MKKITFLQWATVGTFILFVIAGFLILVLMPDRMPAFKEFLGAIWPLFVAEVIPAFLGKPLKEYVAKK